MAQNFWWGEGEDVLGGIAGGVLGAYAGGPAGAVLGATAGYTGVASLNGTLNAQLPSIKSSPPPATNTDQSVQKAETQVTQNQGKGMAATMLTDEEEGLASFYNMPSVARATLLGS